MMHRSSLIFFFSSLLLLLAHGQECVWPESLYFNHTETKSDQPGVEIPGWFALNLDYTEGGSQAVYRTDGYYDGMCGPEGGNRHTDCLQLVTNGLRYIILPTLGECCVCCSNEDGCGPLGTFWVDGAVNGGIVDVAGTPSYHWKIAGNSVNSLYLAVNDSRVTEITNSDYDIFTANMATYLDTPSNSLFVVPDSCTKRCTKAAHCTKGLSPKENKLSQSELDRASTWVPADEYKGSNMAEASSVLNSHLDKQKELKTRSCSEWTLEELDTVQRWLNTEAHQDLLKIYSEAQDPRQVAEGDNEQVWAKMREVAAESRVSEQLLLAGRCRQTVMWYIHALSSQSQEQFIQLDMVLPRLPTEDEEAHLEVEELVGNEQWAYKVSSRLSSCAQCHVGSL